MADMKGFKAPVVYNRRMATPRHPLRSGLYIDPESVPKPPDHAFPLGPMTRGMAELHTFFETSDAGCGCEGLEMWEVPEELLVSARAALSDLDSRRCEDVQEWAARVAESWVQAGEGEGHE